MSNFCPTILAVYCNFPFIVCITLDNEDLLILLGLFIYVPVFVQFMWVPAEARTRCQKPVAGVVVSLMIQMLEPNSDPVGEQ